MSDPIISSEIVNLALENINDVIVVVGANGLLTYVSPSVRTYGHAPEDLIGLPPSALIHPDDHDRAEENRDAIMRGEGLAPFSQRQNRYRCASGEWIWLEGNPTILRGADGAIVGMVNVLRDITEHREQRDLFEAAFRHAPIGMTISGMDGRFHRVNAAFCQMTGYAEATLMATQVLAISKPTTVTPDRTQIAGLLSGEIETLTMERHYLRPDGGMLEALVTVSMVREQDGSPRYFVAQVQDLTAQRAAEAGLREAQERNRIIAENTSDMIVLSDLDGVTLHVSNAIVETGTSSAAVVGRNFSESVHPDDVKSVRQAFGLLLQGKPAERVRWRGRGGGEGDWLWMESAPSLVRDPVTGEPTRFLDVVRNVSAQVAQEAALEAARAAAEAAGEAKVQFLANMSHEIRTPLTAILGFASLLRETPELSDAASTYVRRISGAGAALLAIVNDILDHSKLEAGKIELRPQATDIGALARETLDLFGAQADEKHLHLNLRLDTAAPPAVLIDPDRVRQILINLVSNAVKFTASGGVDLEVVTLAGCDTLRFTIRDTGPGLDEAQQTRLFQRFSQVDGSSTRQHGGAGLGLAICRGLVEAMGGEIGVTSAPGEGSAFWFTLSAPVAQLAADVAAEPGLELDDVRVLVVDDNAANRELASEVLTVLGAEVTLASDGREALALLAVVPIDIILIDLHLPDMNGFGVLAALRAAPGPNRDIPALAFTAADADTNDLSGFDGLVAKPFAIRAMATTINAALEAPSVTITNARSADHG